MDLATYLGAERGRAAAIAAAMRVPAVLLSQWKADRPVPAERCPDLERATGGAVTAEEARPDVRWVRVADETWPNPAGRPCIDVAADMPSAA